jgi:hypothetical protein
MLSRVSQLSPVVVASLFDVNRTIAVVLVA